MSCTLSRTRLPTRCADPSSTASTFSSRAISGSDSVVPLYRIADVLEITRSALMRARSEITASVIPSAKYSCAGSCETLRNGRTAIARMASFAGPDAGPLDWIVGQPPQRFRHRGRRGRPACPVLLEARRDQAVEVVGRVRPERCGRDGAGVLMIANISACGRSCANGRCPVASSNSIDAERVDVGARVVGLAERAVRAPCRAASPSRSRPASAGRSIASPDEQQREAEVEDLRPAVRRSARRCPASGRGGGSPAGAHPRARRRSPRRSTGPRRAAADPSRSRDSSVPPGTNSMTRKS